MSSERRPPQRVFLSYTTELSRLPDGRSFVAVAEAAVIRAGHAPVHMEHFTAEDAPPAEVCRELVRTCDVFVLIAGFRHGSLVADEPWRSYTELEHATATEAGITRRIFLLGERVTSRAELMGGDRQDDRQEAFRERLRTSGVTVATVHSTDELGLAVFQALAMLAVDRPSTHPLHSIPPGRLAFIGREAVLDRIAAGLGGGGCVALTGMSGVGKTSTAIAYAHRHSAELDIVWWIRAADPEMVPVWLAELARTLELANDRESDQVAVARLRGHLSRRDRWLLLFDDVPDARVLEPYLPRGRGQVLITSRSPAWRGTASTTVEIPLLDRPESIAMLRTWTSEIKEAAADLVAEAVGDLPQAIDQAGSLLTVGGLTVGEYLHLLDECAVEIHGHDARGTTPPAAATWMLSFDHLAKDDPAAMDLLSLIAWCGPAPVPRSVLVPRPDRSDLVDDSAFPDRSARPDRSVPLPATLRAVANNPLALADKIGVLHLRGLVVATNPVVLHRVPASLLKARRGVDEPIPWAAVVVRLLRAALPDNVWDNPSRWDIWRRLLPHVRAATAAGRDTHSAREHVAWLLDRMATYLQTTGDPRAALPVFRRALRIARSHLGGDHPATLFYANNLAHDLHDLGHHREAFALNQDTFARRRRDLGDNHQDTLKSAKNLARNLFDLGEFDKARAMDDDVLARRRRVLGIDHEDTLNSARNLANDLRALGEHDQARALHEETLHRLHRTLGEEHPRSLQCASDLADDLCAAGEYGRACYLHEETLDRRRRILGDDHPHTLTSAHDLARALIGVGAATRARDLLQDTLERRRQVLGDGHPDVDTARRLTAVVEALSREGRMPLAPPHSTTGSTGHETRRHE